MSKTLRTFVVLTASLFLWTNVSSFGSPDQQTRTKAQRARLKDEHLDRFNRIVNYEVINLTLSNMTDSANKSLSFIAYGAQFDVELYPNEKMVASRIKQKIPPNVDVSNLYFATNIESCHYSGHIKNARKSVVAISICENRGIHGMISSDNDTLVIKPKNFYDFDNIDYHHWMHEHLIYKESQFNNSNALLYGYMHNDGEIPIDHDLMDSMTLNSAHIINNNKRRLSQSSLDYTVELMLVSDPSFTEYYQLQYGSDDRWYDELIAVLVDHVNWASAVFYSTDWEGDYTVSLSIIRVDVWFTYDDSSVSYYKLRENVASSWDSFFEVTKYLASQWLSAFHDWLLLHESMDNYDAAQLWTYDRIIEGSGYGYVGTMCRPGLGSSIVSTYGTWYSWHSRTAAHEIGHNFGMRHDGNGNDCIDDQGIMGFGSSTKFSSCNLVELNNHVTTRDVTCLTEEISTSSDNDIIASATCGNSIVEDANGEECDCGEFYQCPFVDSCCDPYTCTYIEDCDASASCPYYPCVDISGIVSSQEYYTKFNGVYYYVGCGNGEGFYVHSDGTDEYSLYFGGGTWWISHNGQTPNYQAETDGGITATTGLWENQSRFPTPIEIAVCERVPDNYNPVVDDGENCDYSNLNVSSLYLGAVCINNITIADSVEQQQQLRFAYSNGCKDNYPYYTYSDGSESSETSYYLHYVPYTVNQWMISTSLSAVSGFAYCENERILKCGMPDYYWYLETDGSDFIDYQIDTNVVAISCAEEVVIFDTSQTTPPSGPVVNVGSVSIDSTDGVHMSLSISVDVNKATVTMSGRSGQWLGVGFGSQTMTNTYAVIYTTNNGLFESILGSHEAGHVITPCQTQNESCVSLLNVTDDGDNLTVTWQRENNPLSSTFSDDNDLFVFDFENDQLDVIWAVGSSMNFSLHDGRGNVRIELEPLISGPGASVNSGASENEDWTLGTHGAMIFLAFGVFVPFGALLNRFLGSARCCNIKAVQNVQQKHEHVWVQVHQGMMVFAWVLAMIGFIVKVIDSSTSGAHDSFYVVLLWIIIFVFSFYLIGSFVASNRNKLFSKYLKHLKHLEKNKISVENKNDKRVIIMINVHKMLEVFLCLFGLFVVAVGVNEHYGPESTEFILYVLYFVLIICVWIGLQVDRMRNLKPQSESKDGAHAAKSSAGSSGDVNVGAGMSAHAIHVDIPATNKSGELNLPSGVTLRKEESPSASAKV